MKNYFGNAGVLLLALTIGCGGAGAGTSAKQGATDLSGKWNVILTKANATTSYISFGLNITESGTMLQGTAIPYSSPTGGGGDGCFAASNVNITQGTLNGASIAMIITNDTNQEVNLLNMAGTIANGAVTGNFGLNMNPTTGSVSAHRSSPQASVFFPCSAVQGTSSLTRQ